MKKKTTKKIVRKTPAKNKMRLSLSNFENALNEIVSMREIAVEKIVMCHKDCHMTVSNDQNYKGSVVKFEVFLSLSDMKSIQSKL